MKKKEFITEAKKKTILAERENAILESFAETFKKIKRVDEDFDYADAERQYHDQKDFQVNHEDTFVIVIPYEDQQSISVPSMNKKKLAFVGPNHKLVHSKQEAQVFSKDEAESVKNALTNKKAYVELA